MNADFELCLIHTRITYPGWVSYLGEGGFYTKFSTTAHLIFLFFLSISVRLSFYPSFLVLVQERVLYCTRYTSMLVLVRPILSVDTIVPLKTLAISERMSSAFRIRGASTRALTPNIACNNNRRDTWFCWDSSFAGNYVPYPLIDFDEKWNLNQINNPMD